MALAARPGGRQVSRPGQQRAGRKGREGAAEAAALTRGLTSPPADHSAAGLVGVQDGGEAPGQQGEEEGAEGQVDGQAGQQVEGALPGGAARAAGCSGVQVVLRSDQNSRKSKGFLVPSKQAAAPCPARALPGAALTRQRSKDCVAAEVQRFVQAAACLQCWMAVAGGKPMARTWPQTG